MNTFDISSSLVKFRRNTSHVLSSYGVSICSHFSGLGLRDERNDDIGEQRPAAVKVLRGEFFVAAVLEQVDFDGVLEGVRIG